MCFSFHVFKEECYTGWILTPWQFVCQRYFCGIHFSSTNDTFREWNSRRLPWCAFIYSVPAVGKIWIPGVQAKFWNPKGSIAYPGDVLLSWAHRPGRGWQATVQAFESQLGPQSVAKSSGNAEWQVLQTYSTHLCSQSTGVWVTVQHLPQRTDQAENPLDVSSFITDFIGSLWEFTP